MEKILFISDIHLDAEEPERIGQFIRFLEFAQTERVTLYILGDLFNFWAGNAQAWLGTIRKLVRALKLFHAQGRLFFLDGNRDFLYAPYWQQQGGHTLTEGTLLCLSRDYPTDVALVEPAHRTLTDVSVMLYHGDTLFTADVKYQRLRALLRQRWIYWAARLLPASVCLSIGRKLRLMSQREVSRKSDAEMALDYRYIRNILEESDADVMICGHRHHEEVVDIPLAHKQAKLYVLPENRGLQLRYLLWDQGTFTFYNYPCHSD